MGGQTLTTDDESHVIYLSDLLDAQAQDVKAIQERLQARTAGPLTLDRDPTDGPSLPFKIMAEEPGRGERVHLVSPAGLRQADAVFHASAPDDIKFLLKVIREQRLLIEMQRAELRGREPGS